MARSSVHSIVSEMEASIELISNNISEAETMFKEGQFARPKRSLMKALSNVEKTVSTIRTHVENGGNLDSFSFKGVSKEYLYVLSELRDAWKTDTLLPPVKK